MQLIIKHLLSCVNPDYIESASEVLAFYNVKHYIHGEEDSAQLFVEPQKITLSSENVNHLLYDCLHSAFDIQLSYSPLGGRGCDLSLNVSSSPTANC